MGMSDCIGREPSWQEDKERLRKRYSKYPLITDDDGKVWTITDLLVRIRSLEDADIEAQREAANTPEGLKEIRRTIHKLRERLRELEMGVESG